MKGYQGNPPDPNILSRRVCAHGSEIPGSVIIHLINPTLKIVGHLRTIVGTELDAFFKYEQIRVYFQYGGGRSTEDIITLFQEL